VLMRMRLPSISTQVGVIWGDPSFMDVATKAKFLFSKRLLIEGLSKLFSFWLISIIPYDCFYMSHLSALLSNDVKKITVMLDWLGPSIRILCILASPGGVKESGAKIARFFPGLF
jgi:hypothetical protein